MESLETIESQIMETEKESIVESSSKSSHSDQDLSQLTEMLSGTTSESQTAMNVTDTSEVSLTPDLETTNSFLNSILENSSNLEEFSRTDSAACSPQQNSVTDVENSQNQESMEEETRTDENILKSPLSKEVSDEVPMEVDEDDQILSKNVSEEEKAKEDEGTIEDEKTKVGEEEKTQSEVDEGKLEESVSDNLPSSSLVESVNQSTSSDVEEITKAADTVERTSSSEEVTETESHVFVQVNERERDENKTAASPDDSQEQDEEFDNNQPQEDPIASDDFENIPMEDENDENDQAGDEEQGASEELCIIPDTERVISQEEKDAASIMPLRTEPTENSDNSSKQPSSETSGQTEVNDSLVTKYMATLNTDESDYTCMQCNLLRRCKYTIAGNNGGNCRYVCDESCFKTVKELYNEKLDYVGESEVRVKNLGTNSDNMVAQIKYVRKCANCFKEIMNDGMNLSWEIMEFCNETCLSKYQKKIGSNCANCNGEVKTNCLGKYSVRFGYDIRQFCSSVCLEEYKKGLKACSYCQKDMSGGGDGFLAPVGDKGQFKDFCTKICMERYDRTSNNRTPAANRSAEECSVCNKKNPVSIEFELNNKMNLFCGEPCFVAFKFVNNIVPGKCDMCRKYFDNKVLEENSIFYDNAQHSFCSNTCQNIYIIAQRKIVPCSWCKVKKYNFDMIKKLHGPTGALLCSLNCYNLYQVSVNARISCDQCCKNAEPMYHLTMSDATIRNFCSHSCAVTFQNHFPKSLSSEDPSIPVPVGKPKKSKRTQNESTSNSDMPTMPVISSVHSLAMTNGPTSNRTTRGAKNKIDSSINSYQSMKTQIKQQIIIKSAPMPTQKNIGTMCKIRQSNKSVNVKPVMVDKEMQTDDLKDKTAVIPIPVPIYVPTPSCMYSLPFPIPFPFALPIPVPIFIPTTRNSATGIMKEIKKIQVKIPTDPFEAELLMMAEMVAGDKKEENTDSESEEEDTPAPPEEVPYNPEPIEPSNTFGEDMLQMALKMATELDEPAVDLEGALTANTITASQTGETGSTEEAVDDPQPMHHLMERQPTRGRKRPGRPPRHGGPVSKRGRRSSSQMDIPLMAPPQAPQPAEPVEKPDANMCLKYTFGVNAWKQWVTTKNAELEKSPRRVKLFKPEILQLTADELNYSLCLFVKEVRKPNGQEYAPDTIYYLCLGIQQYLFENGRIDNIFCDTYYEKFTDCLDEVARKFSVLYNDSHYIVTRVEEEHLWESKQLGAHSPHVLLSTLMFFNTKHFNLTSVDEHMQLSFSHIMKHWKRNPNQPGSTNKVGGSRNVLLRFYPPQTATQTNLSLDAATRKKKVYEQQENEENPLRCPVKLYEFYLSKCPESVKTRNDVFYLLPERSCVPDSPVWYSTMPLPRNALEKMLHRVKMVKEINVALLTS